MSEKDSAETKQWVNSLTLDRKSKDTRCHGEALTTKCSQVDLGAGVQLVEGYQIGCNFEISSESNISHKDFDFIQDLDGKAMEERQNMGIGVTSLSLMRYSVLVVFQKGSARPC